MPNIDPACAIYGMGVEDDHHALIGCTLARALRHELRSVWPLPPKEVSVRNRQVVFPEGQRPQHIVTCIGENMQETP
jgi:hypothetical protein